MQSTMQFTEDDSACEDEEVIIQSRRTRYGRSVKKPVRYEPVERVEDDFSDSDYDVPPTPPVLCVDVDCESITSENVESDNSDNESDADENGNLKDFVAYSDDEEEVLQTEEKIEEPEEEEDTDSEDSDSDYESSDDE